MDGCVNAVFNNLSIPFFEFGFVLIIIKLYFMVVGFFLCKKSISFSTNRFED